jgi:hypothetical protein
MEQTQLQGLKNYSRNIKDLMLTMHNNKKPIRLSTQDQSLIVEYYLEVVDYLAKQND